MRIDPNKSVFNENRGGEYANCTIASFTCARAPFSPRFAASADGKRRFSAVTFAAASCAFIGGEHNKSVRRLGVCEQRRTRFGCRQRFVGRFLRLSSQSEGKSESCRRVGKRAVFQNAEPRALIVPVDQLLTLIEGEELKTGRALE